MRLMLLGCPGAGKGTQAKFITEKFHIAQISTGDMLRAAITAKSPLGLEVQQVLNEGKLVSDDIMIKLVKKRVEEPDCKNGYLLDGFPRTIRQAEALQENQIHLDYIIEISVPDEDIIARLSGRRVHLASGRVYHVEFNPPKQKDIDDVTGEALVHRSDDYEETIKKRIAVYHLQTEPLIKYYTDSSINDAAQKPTIYIKVDGRGTMQEVSSRIFTAIEKAEKSYA